MAAGMLRFHGKVDRLATHHDRDSLSERLWNQAYDDLQAGEPTPVSAYEKILSRELDDRTGPAGTAQNAIEKDRLARRAQMQRLIRADLKKTEREANAKRRISDTMDIFLSVEGIVDYAVQTVPQAALAWTGVCFALQVGNRGSTTAYTNFA